MDILVSLRILYFLFFFFLSLIDVLLLANRHFSIHTIPHDTATPVYMPFMNL